MSKAKKERQNKGSKKRGSKTSRLVRLGRFVKWSALFGIWGAFALLIAVGYYAHDLPDAQTILAKKRPAIVTILARDDSVLGTYGGGYGDWLEPDEVPQNLVHAVLAVEDRRFHSHGGVDFRGLTRAVFANLWAGGIVQGGSTLTQQLAKNLFLKPDRTIKRKVQELLLALWLEQKFSKNEILAMYLNRVYFGAGTYGVDAAAHRYFGVSARDVVVNEAALLAGLLKAPSRYSPATDRQAATDRMNVVLGTMVDAGYLSAEERANMPPVQFAAPPGEPDERYFTDWVMRELAGLISRPEQDIVVRTTLDPGLQTAAATSLSATLDEHGKARHVDQGAVVVMSADGAVRAMVGGRSYKQSEFNRAVNARRQPGSAFKLFVYLAAFEAGLRPDTQMRDSPVTLDGWQPQNYDGLYRGSMSLRDAFAKSINTVAVKLAERSNRANVIRMAKRLGITTPVASGPSMALGTSEVRLIDLTGAYATIANDGRGTIAYGIVEIGVKQGEEIYRRRGDGIGVLVAPERVAQITSLLRETTVSGTGRAAQLSDRSAAGKTGTSQDFRDAWFVGFSNDMVAGVWLGNDDNTPMERVTGGSLPAHIWRDVMQHAVSGRLTGALATGSNPPDGG